MFYENFSNGRQREMQLAFCDRDENLPPGIVYGPVIRDLFVVDCCAGGYGTVTINGTTFPLQKGDCIILYPGDIVVHTADQVEPRYGLWCVVDGLMIPSLLARAGITSQQPFAPREAFAAIYAQIEEMMALRDESDSGVELRRSACVSRMFGELLRYSAPEPDNRDKLIEHALQIIDARYDQDLKIGDIADTVGLERCYFSTVFKEITGMSPYQYITNVRLKKACTLMTEGHYKICAAAEAVGIAPESFARVFRQHFGVTPGEFVRNAQDKK